MALVHAGDRSKPVAAAAHAGTEDVVVVAAAQRGAGAAGVAAAPGGTGAAGVEADPAGIRVSVVGVGSLLALYPANGGCAGTGGFVAPVMVLFGCGLGVRAGIGVAVVGRGRAGLGQLAR